MTRAPADPWRSSPLPPVRALALGLVHRTRSIWEWMRVDHGALVALLRTLFLVDARGGRFVPSSFNSRFIWVLMPLLFLVLGLFTGIGTLLGKLGPLEWMATVQLTGATALAAPILLRDATRLLDDPDRAVLSGRPISSRTRAAAQSVHVIARHLPNALCFIAGPMLLGPMLHGPLVLVLAPLATLTSLVVLLTVLPAGWSLLSRLLGLRPLRRLSAVGEVAALSLLVGGGGLIGRLLLPVLQTMAATVRELPPAAYLLPPVQWGGLLALVLGDVSRATVTLSVLAVSTPMACVLLWLWLARLGVVRQNPVSATERWPRSPLAAALTRTPEERAGFGLASALFTRDANILKHVWPITIGGTLFLIVGIARSLPAFGTIGHWAPLFLWPMIPVIMLLGLHGVEISAHAQGAGVFRQLPVASRDSALAGAMRGAFLTLVFPVSVGTLLLAWSVIGPRGALDMLAFQELGFILVVEQKVRLLSPLPFSEFESSSGTRRKPPAGRAVSRELAATKVGPATLMLAMGCSTVALALLHLNPRLMIAACVGLLLPMWRAWRRLDLLRTG